MAGVAGGGGERARRRAAAGERDHSCRQARLVQQVELEVGVEATVGEHAVDAGARRRPHGLPVVVAGRRRPPERTDDGGAGPPRGVDRRELDRFEGGEARIDLRLDDAQPGDAVAAEGGEDLRAEQVPRHHRDHQPVRMSTRRPVQPAPQGAGAGRDPELVHAAPLDGLVVLRKEAGEPVGDLTARVDGVDSVLDPLLDAQAAAQGVLQPGRGLDRGGAAGQEDPAGTGGEVGDVLRLGAVGEADDLDRRQAIVRLRHDLEARRLEAVANLALHRRVAVAVRLDGEDRVLVERSRRARGVLPFSPGHRWLRAP